MNDPTPGRNYQAPIWDEPIVMEMGATGRRAFVPPSVERAIEAATGDLSDLIPPVMARDVPPDLPELTEFEVQRHYIHLAQQTLGMLGVNLFGTCTMKYNPRLGEVIAARPDVAEIHPAQDLDTLQGILAIIYGLDLALREVSGMDQFVFQAGGGADAAYLNTCVARAYHADRGELDTRDEVITTIQAHPCNAATAAAGGFKVVTLTLDEQGYPSVEQLRSVVSERTAALMITNPDDMGIYNRAHQGMGGDRPRCGWALLLRSRELQRGDGQNPRRRARVRRLHVHAAQELRGAEGIRRACSWCLRLRRKVDPVLAATPRDT